MSESLNLPQTFIDKYHKLLGSSFASFIAALNSETKRAFRLNPLKYNFQNVSYSLDNLVPGTKLGYYGDVSGKSSDWVSGYVYSQDPSAMFPAIALNVHPGEKVLDLCAAPGGKTTALASDLAGEGVLVANEISKSRAKILRENLERWGADNVAIINEDSKRVSDKLPHFFDAILVDAPCSGEGMFRKNPEAIQYWSPEYVLTCQSRQKEILTNAVKNLRSGGRLVYSTCTFSPEEDEQIVEWLVNKFKMKIEPITEFDVGQAGHPEWSKTNNPDLAKTRRFWPQDNVGEGQFVALLSLPEQIGGDVKIKKVKKDRRKIEILTKVDKQMIMDFLSKFNLPFKVNKFELRQGHVVMPILQTELAGLHILSNGIELGALKKNRFEPSHQLAEILGQKEQEQVYEIASEDQYLKYLHGETLRIESEILGFILVSYHHQVFSFGKIDKNKVLKNFYPKGLRI